MADAAATTFYGGSDQYLRHLAAKDEAIFATYVEDVARHLPSHARLLELGCGAGQATELFARKGYDVLGTDLSPKFIESCRTARPHLRFEALDITRCDALPPAMWDGVTSRAVFEHIADVEAALVGCDRLLRPGGLLFIYGPNLLSPFNVPRAVAKAAIARAPIDTPMFRGPRGAARFVVDSVRQIESKRRGRIEFLKRVPDFERGHYGGDWDASYVQTQTDYEQWLRRREYQIIQLACSFGGRAARFITRLAPRYAGGCGVVARKPGA